MTLTTVQAVRRATIDGLDTAVHQKRALSKAGLLERLFTFAFRGLVYPQIWEDPVIDMEALAIKPDDHIVTIASGGCNAPFLSLRRAPARISAIDLNGAHIALGRLKLCRLEEPARPCELPLVLRQCRQPRQRRRLRRYVLPHLDATTRRELLERAQRAYGRRRIDAFSRNFLPLRPARNLHRLAATCSAGSTAAIRRHCSPPARWPSSAPSSTRRSHRSSTRDSPGGCRGSRPRCSASASRRRSITSSPPTGPAASSAVLRHRLERLACDFDIKENYFAWQAFGRRYATSSDDALPPYLQKARNFDAIRGIAPTASPSTRPR